MDTDSMQSASTGFVPAEHLKANRSIGKLILLNILTLGIYGIVFYTKLGNDINIIASRYDLNKTMHFCLIFFFFGPLTAEIVTLIWFHRISNRIGYELARRKIDYMVDAETFWGWGFFGSLIIVGPFIYMAKVCTAMNKLCADYNARG